MTTNDIIVGFDGSAQSRAALRFAVTQAQRMGATVRAVTAYDYNWGAGRFGGSETLEHTAARVLVDVSSNAGLVVVGARGHGGITDTLLGSVSLQVLHHANCPVPIVHPTHNADVKE